MDLHGVVLKRAVAALDEKIEDGPVWANRHLDPDAENDAHISPLSICAAHASRTQMASKDRCTTVVLN